MLHINASNRAFDRKSGMLSRTPRELIDALLPRILAKEWDIVAQLAFQMQHKRFEEAGDDLLLLLLQYVSQGISGWNVLLFAVRCLEFMIPSQPVKRAIVEACVEQVIKWGISISSSNDFEAEDDLRHINRGYARELISSLRKVAIENRDTVCKQFKTDIRKYANGSDQEASLAFQIASALSIRFLDDPDDSFWSEVSEQVFQELEPLWRKLLPEQHLLCLRAWQRQEVSIDDLVDWHGGRSIFEPAYHLVYGVYFNPPAHMILSKVHSHNLHRDNIQNELEKIVDVFEQHPLPWITLNKDNAHYYSFDFSFHETGISNSLERLLGIGSKALYGVFVLMLSLVEIEEKIRDFEGIRKLITDSKLPILKLTKNAILVRSGACEANKLSVELASYGFSQPQQDCILEWSVKGAAFVK